MSAFTDTQHEEIALLLPDFAVGVLDDGDAWRVEAHMLECHVCQREFEFLLELVGTISAPVIPSPDRKSALFSAIGISPPASPAMNQPVALSVRRKSGLWKIASQRILPIAAAVALLAMGFWNYQLRETTDDQQVVLDLVEDPAAAHPLTDAEVPTSAMATMYVDPGQSEALLVASGLSALPAGEHYAVWLFTAEGERIKGGELVPDEDGGVVAIIEAPIAYSNYWAVGVSIETDRDTEGPTTPLIIGGWIQ